MKSAALRNIAVDDVERARQAWGGGAPGQARKLLERHLAKRPRDTRALHLRAVVAMGQGEHAQAVQWMAKTLELEGSNADFWCDYGTALHGAGQREEAREAYLRALDLRPDHLDAVFNLANVLRELKQLKDALSFYSALLERNPEYRYAWSNTGLVLLELGHLEEARRCFSREIELDPKNAGAHVNLGHVLRELGRVEEAIATYRQGLVLSPRYPELHLNMGVALNSLGDVASAISHLREAIRLNPAYATAHHSLIFTLDFDPRSSTRAQQEARRAWYRDCVKATGARRPLRDLDPERRLRIGFVSADFRNTSAAMTFAPMLWRHDRKTLEAYCYSNSVQEDDLTHRLREHCAGFRFIGGLTDAQAAQLIARDQIDILVDLSGHMQGNRLALFAHRPAPLQITAWGYANGTGMPEMDYIIADGNYLPDNVAVYFTERRLDVPAVIPYQPFEALPPLPSVPVDLDRPIRFGCYSRWQKISDDTITLWSQVMRQVPDAELVLKASQVLDQHGIEAMRARFVAQGVSAERIRFLPRAGWVAHLESFSEIDLQLDPYPHGGGISLLDGIAMGVPTLTLQGATPPARLGASLMQAIGAAQDCIAQSREVYVELAQAWAQRRQELRTGRAALRARLLASPVGDTDTYVKAVEAALRRAWRESVPSLHAARQQALQSARDAIRQGRGKAAAEIVMPIVQDCPKDAEATHLAGVAAMLCDDRTEARNLLERSLSLDPTCAEAWVNLGVLLTKSSQIEAALSAMTRARELEPANPEIHYNLGCCLLKTGNYSEAGKCFETVLTLHPAHALATNNLGIVRERSGDMTAAEQLFRQALKCDPQFAMGHANVGRVLVDREAFEEAIPYFERALQLDQSLHWLRYELAVWYERCGYEARLHTLYKDPFKPATTPPAKTRTGTADARLLSRITDCVRAAFARSGTSTAEISENLMEMSGRLMEVDHAAKNQLLDEAIALYPTNLPAYSQAGISLHHDGRYEAANQRWQEGLRQRDAMARAAGLLDYPHRVLDPSWYMAVGHLQMLDIYVKSVELGMRPRRDLWLMRTPHRKVPNESYLDYWRPWVHTDAPMRGDSNLVGIANAVGLPLDRLPLITDHFFADRVDGGHELWHMAFAAEVQRRWEADGRGSLLRLSEADEAFGRDTLAQLGVPVDAWFVCLHVREPGFWGKWDKFHPSIRNARIQSYEAAIDRVVARGGWVIRMGDRTMTPLAPRPGVVDYAHSAMKSERMDLFLSGAARLFVGVNSGLSLLPPTFGVPCLLTNFVPISIPFPYGRDRLLPKLFRSKRDGRLVTFKQMFEQRVAHAQFAKHVPDWMEIVENEPAEIADAIEEMLDELDGRTAATDSEAFAGLRRRYDDILRAAGNFTGSPIAGRFLRRHAELLE